MSNDRVAEALGWVKVGSRDVGDMAPAWYDDYRTPDGRIVNEEPPYFQNAVAQEIRSLAALRPVLAAVGPVLEWFWLHGTGNPESAELVRRLLDAFNIATGRSDRAPSLDFGAAS